ncbi:MAG: nicotinate-nucleotide--dimethylbenzimidazole phosphoribosyltransferase [Candidatus Limnocylindrales bacterium]
MSAIARTIAAIGPLDDAIIAAARARQDSLAKPPGSLGRLESLAVQLAGIRAAIVPIDRPAVVVMAGDHGVAAEGISAYPASVTVEMVRTFLAGRAAINVIGSIVGARVVIVDMGTAEPVSCRGLIVRRIGDGTRNLAEEPAMSAAQANAAMEAGIEIAVELADDGIDLIVPGEMGIGNTTSASCIVAALTGNAPTRVTGRGTGVDRATMERKRAVVAGALVLHRDLLGDPRGVLAAVGGFEIAGLVGLCLGAASRRVPILLDGLISTAAGLAAASIAPALRAYLIAGHESVEPGHRVALAALGLRPLLTFDMRLGEGSGAALAIPIVRAAASTLATMALLSDVLPREGLENR